MVKKNSLKVMLISCVIVLVLLILTIFLINGNKSDIVESKEPINIGVIVPLSGNLAVLGEYYYKGVQLSVDKINENGGINGQKINLIVEDCRGDAKEGATIANKFVMRGDITGVIVHGTTIANAVAPIFEANKIPFVAHGADSGLPMNYEYAFKTFYNAYEECQKLITYSNEAGMQKYGLLLPNIPWGTWCYNAITEIVDEENIVDLRYNYGEMDFKALLLKAKDENVDAIVWKSLIHEGNVVNKQKVELDIDIPFVCGPLDNCMSDKVLEEIDMKYFEGNIVFGFDKSESFMLEHADVPSTNFIDVAFGYDGMQIVVSALKQCDEISSQCLYEKMKTVRNYDSAINSNGFDETRNMILHTDLYVVENGEIKQVS